MSQTIALPKVPNPHQSATILQKIGISDVLYANKFYALGLVTICVFEFTIFKLLFPYPSIEAESMSYIDANIYHMDANIYSIAYSKFLLLLHAISHADTLVVATQYLLLELALAYFYLTVCHLYHPLKSTRVIIFLLLSLNPLFLFVSNSILPDALFTSFSIIFLTQLLWLAYRPTVEGLIVQAIFAGLAFSLNSVAISYPLLTFACMVKSHSNIQYKLVGLLSSCATMLLYYILLTTATKTLTGRSQYSVIDSWMAGNNALYMYKHLKLDSTTIPQPLATLNRLANRTSAAEYPSVGQFEGPYFIKSPTAILQPYAQQRNPYSDPKAAFVSWAMVATTIHQFGVFLIERYPLQYLQFYLIPNTENYFLPNQESLAIYNRGKTAVAAHVQDWFDYVAPDITCASISAEGKLCYLFPILFLVMNCYFLAALMSHTWNKSFQRFAPFFKISVYLVLLYILVNAIQSVIGQPIVFRQQLTPFIVLCAFCPLLLEFPENIHQYIPQKKA